MHGLHHSALRIVSHYRIGLLIWKFFCNKQSQQKNPKGDGFMARPVPYLTKRL
jgi:hypothetical protein